MEIQKREKSTNVYAREIKNKIFESVCLGSHDLKKQQQQQQYWSLILTLNFLWLIENKNFKFKQK
jgi:hypothetical protein